MLTADAGCCLSNPLVSVHAVLTSPLEPEIDDVEVMQAPEMWNPVVAQSLSFVNLKPYIYQPSPHIAIHNQAGAANFENQMTT